MWEKAEADGGPSASWFHTGALHDERARVLAPAGCLEGAPPAAELAVTAYEAGGNADVERPRGEAARFAAVIEGGSLGRTDTARTRLAAAIQRRERARGGRRGRDPLGAR
ncbi:hypothetical protein ACIQGZ_25640 [Streptomyces sp. NPDC092296]|uniref:hypothetical protein n=1 Tax=Streptomyces sp. NPDC092296 TaxID=3366012 RepID=UPI00382B8D59